MSGPWEDYAATAAPAAAAASSAPWEDYAASTPVTGTDRAHALEGGVLGGLAYGASAIPDAIANTYLLGKAGLGAGYQALTGKPGWDVGDPFPVGRALTGLMDKSDLTSTQAPRPDDTLSRYLNTTGNVIGGVAGGGGAGGVKAATKAVLAGTPGALAGRAVAEAKPFDSDAANNTASILTQVLGTAAAGAPMRGRGELLPENQIKNDAVTAGQGLGYQFPPATTNPTRGNIARETIAGKTNVAQHMAISNQKVTNEAARSDLGLPTNAGYGISDLELAQARKDASPGYDALRGAGTITPPNNFAQQLSAALAKQSGAGRLSGKLADNELSGIVGDLQKTKSFDAGDAMDAIEALRDKASGAYSQGSKQAGKAYKGVATAIEDAMQSDLTKRGGQSADLVQGFQDSRRKYAIINTVEENRDATTGNVLAQKLAAALKSGDYMTGSLKVAGKAAGQAPQAFQQPNKSAGSHMGVAGALMGGGALAEMVPESVKKAGVGSLALAATYPLARWATRQYVQGPGQKNALPRTKPLIWTPSQIAGAYPVAAEDSTR